MSKVDKEVESIESQISVLQSKLKQKQDEQKEHKKFQERDDMKRLKKLRDEYEAKGKEIEAAEDAIPEIKNQKILTEMEEELDEVAKKGGRHMHYREDYCDSDHWTWENKKYEKPWNRFHDDYIKKAKEFGIKPKDYMKEK